MNTELIEMSDRVFETLTLSPLTRAEIETVLADVVARCAAIPTGPAPLACD